MHDHRADQTVLNDPVMMSPFRRRSWCRPDGDRWIEYWKASQAPGRQAARTHLPSRPHVAGQRPSAGHPHTQPIPEEDNNGPSPRATLRRRLPFAAGPRLARHRARSKAATDPWKVHVIVVDGGGTTPNVRIGSLVVVGAGGIAMRQREALGT